MNSITMRINFSLDSNFFQSYVNYLCVGEKLLQNDFVGDQSDGIPRLFAPLASRRQRIQLYGKLNTGKSASGVEDLQSFPEKTDSHARVVFTESPVILPGNDGTNLSYSIVITRTGT